jgi:hypothetical protein
MLGRIPLLNNLRQFSLLITFATVCLLFTACTRGGESPAELGGNNASNASSPNSASNAELQHAYPGAIDTSNCEQVGGWVETRADPKAETKVELYIDGKLVETMPARTLRPDLTSWGSGLYGFSFKIPSAYKDGNAHVVAVKVAGTEYALPFFERNSPNIQCKQS